MLEIIAMTPEDARRIEACGGDRIELISAFSEGGLTPSYGMIEKVVEAVNIPVNVMVRPHAKSFVYTKEEIEIMKKDIAIVKELGANGVVLGTLNEKGEICEELLQELLAACDGLEVTFHRAMDELSDPVEGIRLLSKYPQIKTVLTSGGKGAISQNGLILREMMKNTGHIQVMLGGGLSLENIRPLLTETGASHCHFGTAVRHHKSIFGEIDEAKLKTLVKLIQID